MAVHVVEREIGGRTLRLETGKIAKQAEGAVMVTYGETVVLATVVSANPREGIDFFPLSVDYREKMYAAGKFPGGFFKREARPSTKEILTMRMTDRPIRPLFPDGFRNEVQIQTMALSSDQENDPDILAMIGASAALAVSPIPFMGPTGAARVGRTSEGEFIVNPTMSQRAESDIEVLVAGHGEAVNMIEASGLEVAEEVMAEAIAVAFGAVQEVVSMIDELAKKVAPVKQEFDSGRDPSLAGKVRELCDKYDLKGARYQKDKATRKAAVKEVEEKVIADLIPEGQEDSVPWTRNEVWEEVHKLEEYFYHKMVMETDQRPDGRDCTTIRPIDIEVGCLPRVHGSSLFTRGQTQAMVVVTLGTKRDEQFIDDLVEEYNKKFLLHYNFPPFCTGEAKRIGAVSRREIGHGNLAERALQAVIPMPEKFPYTIRLVSEIMESNGSSSMASVCGGTLALMDAGVPIRHPIAGISIGMVHDEHGGYKLITDILGEEDHFGDMDFKVAGSQFGITAIQLDLKAKSITQQQIVETLAQAKDARMHILKQMLSKISKPRAEISTYAPRMLTIKVDQDKIGKIIGPGGKGIKAIEADTGAKIDIDSDGTVSISSLDAKGAQAAYDIVEQISEGVKIGRVYHGRVSAIKDFGAFVEVAPGLDGLCHISELSDEYVQKVTDVCNVGDELDVKVIMIDDTGRIKLSRKAVLLEEKGISPDAEGGHEPAAATAGGNEGGEDRPRRGGGGGRGGRGGRGGGGRPRND
ncbi:MAG: polyribonucleotide nucleotidyltransferase [Phycisphaerales bacterium]|nr:polyribonucleotide nucleotidyltransferase [Phycisphaerales bacterium]MCB9856856.1 polyribonucleotide nucleotidyltransferase [Phycisphaerales bacterium]MCB9862017.1 polyribonucleotide nucleotidyltransferase [Phycisphaerales bacterium]